MEDERRDSNGTIGEGQKPGALKIYDGALSEGFSDDLIEIFNTNEKAHTRNQNDTLNFLEYNYTTNHKDEDVHKRLMEHTGQLYKHYLEDLGTTNMIKASGFEEIKIHKYDYKLFLVHCFYRKFRNMSHQSLLIIKNVSSCTPQKTLAHSFITDFD